MGDPRKEARSSLWCIVLAAGGSARLGRPKQLVRHRGQTLLARALGLAAWAAPGRIVVVLGADALRLRMLVRRQLPRPRVARNRKWRDGMAGSLALGLGRLPRSARGALILLGDQPRLSRRSLAPLIRRFSPRSNVPVVASYEGRAGAPAVLPRKLWRDARRLSGDVGARALFEGLHRVIRVPVPEASVDVDTAEDLAALGP